jgi:hypothetical protein
VNWPPAFPRRGLWRSRTSHRLTVAELDRLGIRPREAAFDGGFEPAQANRLLPTRRSSSPADNNPHHGDRRSDWPATGSVPRAASATSNAATGSDDHGSEATIGARTWVGWGLLAYNLDTLAAQTVQTG